jgi:DNA polymerase-1
LQRESKEEWLVNLKRERRSLKMVKQVKGVGPSSPRLIAIGEAPGDEEDYQGIPFVGPSGVTSDTLLRMAGLRREECYFDNISPVKPPYNKMERLSELGYSVEDFLPQLSETLKGLDCQVILAYGDTAMWYLTGEGEFNQKRGTPSGIGKHRGSIYPCLLDPSKLVVPTYHPRFCIENYKMRGVVVEDIKKALRIGKGGREDVSFNTRIKPTLQEVIECIEEIREGSILSFDIETVGSGQIACIGLGFYGHRHDDRCSICIPFKFGYQNYWSQDEEIYIWSILRDLFQSDLLKIGQNLNFDLTKLLPFLGEPAPPWADLMMMHHLVEPELPHTLAFITSIYTDIPYYKDDPKDEEKSWKYTTSSEKLWEYNGKDVEGPLIIYPRLLRDLESLGMKKFFEGFMMSKMRVLWRIQQRGLKVDEEKRVELLGIQSCQLLEKQAELDGIVGSHLNANSSKQVTEYLFGTLGLPPQRHRKTKKISSDEDSLKKVQVYHPHPALKLILDIRGNSKEIGTYLLAKVDEDGRMRGRYNAAGAATGRSSSKKTYEKTGLDLHNIPEDDRLMFVSEEGKTFVMRDLWQAEFFVVAMLSQCLPFLERLRAGKKSYKLVASWFFGKGEDEIDDINKPGGEYYTGKRSSHALNYGLGPEKLAMMLECSVKQAKEYKATFFRFASEIANWQMQIRTEVERTRTLVTPFGRKRVFRDRMGEDLYRKAYAHIPQSLIGELNHLGMVKLEYLLPAGCEILQEGYDSLLVEALDEKVEEVKLLEDLAFKKRIFIKGEWLEVPGEYREDKRWTK